jgi:hypothetical protein
MKLKNYVNEEDLLFEEITIGKIEGGYVVSVYSEPLKNPTLHIKNKTDEVENVYQIKNLKLLEQKTQRTFSSKELKLISNWLRQENRIAKGYSNWQAILMQWNFINPETPVSFGLEQPEFNE